MINETVFGIVADKCTSIYEVIVHNNAIATIYLWDTIRWGVTVGVIIIIGIIIILANITIAQVTTSWADMKVICTLATIYVCAICKAGSTISAYVYNQRQRITALMKRARSHNSHSPHNIFEEIYKIISTHGILVEDKYAIADMYMMTCIFKILTLAYAIFDVVAFCSIPIGKIPVVGG